MASGERENISRTKKKKAALALQRLGERLVTLGRGQLDQLELPEELLEAVLAAKEMRKHEARRRQMQYIGSLMRQCDGDVIEKALDDMTRQDDAETQRFKRVERWREELLSGDTERLQWLLGRYPKADLQRLEGLILAAKGFGGPHFDKKAGRKLFRYLRDICEDEATSHPD